MSLKLSTSLRNAQMDAITAAIGNGGLVKIYSGSRPANVAAAITGTLLGTLTGAAPFAPAASGGVLTASALTQDSAADATGAATHFRIFQSDGTTAVMDGDVTAIGDGGDLQLNTTAIVVGGPIVVSSFVLTAGGA